MREGNRLSGKKTVSKNVATVLAVFCVILIIGLNLAVYSYWQQSSAIQEKNDQIQSLQEQLTTPNVVSVGLQFNDDRSGSTPTLRVTGYVVNVGNIAANNCTMHITAIQNGNATAIDTSKSIGVVEAGAVKQVNLEFTYTGSALVAYYPQIQWTT